ncbi:uncharacterized protein [Temnothorax longispinosus]|uniref:uncharacterized protein isoform X1 n=1 Tax=Temnothorax longispinosus TaxID=300112 RepID=UPI003A998C6D
MRPFIAPGATASANTQNSALIAQLTQPSSSLGLNVAAFSQRLDVAGNNVMAANQQQQQQQLTQQQQQLRLTMGAFRNSLTVLPVLSQYGTLVSKAASSVK